MAIGITGFRSGDVVDVSIPSSGDRLQRQSWSKPNPIPFESDINFITANPSNVAYEGINTTIASNAWTNNAKQVSFTAHSPAAKAAFFTATSLTAGNRIYGAPIDLSEYTQWNTGFWSHPKNKCKAMVYRVINGVMTQIRESNVISDNLAFWNNLGFVPDTTFNFQRSTYNWEAHDLYFAVAAVDENGETGAITYAPFTTGSTYPSIKQSNPTEYDLKTVSLNWTNPGVGPLPAPQNLSISQDGDGFVNITWDAPASGTVSHYNVYIGYYGNPAVNTYLGDGKHAELYVELEDDGGPAVQEHDFVNVRAELYYIGQELVCGRSAHTNSYYGFYPYRWTEPGNIELNPVDNGVLDWEFFDWGGANESKPADVNSPTYVAIKLQAGATPQLAAIACHRTSKYDGGDFYQQYAPGDSILFRFWAKADEETIMKIDFADIGATGIVDVATGLSYKELSITTDWSEYEFMFTVPDTFQLEDTSVAQSINVYITSAFTSDGNLYLTDMVTYDEGIEGDFIREIRNDVPDKSYIRDHAFIKPVPNFRRMENMFSKIGTFTKGSIHQHLKYCLDHGQYPWVQIEWMHYTKEEWEFVADYLCAPASSGTAGSNQRVANGQSIPWVDVFDKPIILEFGNEAWNTTSAFGTSISTVDSVTQEVMHNGFTYGSMCRLISDWMENTTYWSSNKIDFYLGGWGNSSTWNDEVIGAFGKPCTTGLAIYNGGWDNGTEGRIPNGVNYQSVLVDPTATELRNTNMTINVQDGINIANARFGAGTLNPGDVKLRTYEGGPGYEINGLNNGSITEQGSVNQLEVMTSRASATATLEAFLMQAENGNLSTNFFVLGVDDTFASHSPYWQRGEAIAPYKLCLAFHNFIDRPAEVYRVTNVVNSTFEYQDSKQLTQQTRPVRAYALRSVANPSTWFIVAFNYEIDKTILETVDPMYASEGDVSSDPKPLLIATPWTTIAGAEMISNEGNIREHNYWKIGEQQITYTVPLYSSKYATYVGDNTKLIEYGTTMDDGAGQLYIARDTYAPSGTIETDVSNGYLEPTAENDVITGARSEPLSVDLDYTPTVQTVPANPSRISLSIQPGGCQIWKFTGVA